MPKRFTKSELAEMNSSHPWAGAIIQSEEVENCNDDEAKFKLHATGSCGISCGRIYIALPENMKLTEDVKSKYNLMLM